MPPSLRRKTSIPCLLSLLIFTTTAGHGAVFENEKLTVTADLRARLESDYDSQRADGRERDDRVRVRLRARLGLELRLASQLSLGLRLRSGSKNSQQSPHVTVFDADGGDTEAGDLNLDRAYFETRRKRGKVWLGRNGLPFWKQNELYWDDDVTPLGMGFVFGAYKGKDEKLAVRGGYFALPVGMREFAGELGALQLEYSSTRLTAALGVLAFEADPEDRDAATLLRGNGGRDYKIWIGSLQGRLDAGRGVTLGLDILHNSENYDQAMAPRDDVDGLVISARYGALTEPGTWFLAYTYARIETLAVQSSYAEDDWVRWGTASETLSSDLRGHELQFAHALAKQMNLVVRWYFVEAITTSEDGNRLRIDFNYTW